jgi:hypothetical protein
MSQVEDSFIHLSHQLVLVHQSHRVEVVVVLVLVVLWW